MIQTDRTGDRSQRLIAFLNCQKQVFSFRGFLLQVILNCWIVDRHRIENELAEAVSQCNFKLTVLDFHLDFANQRRRGRTLTAARLGIAAAKQGDRFV